MSDCALKGSVYTQGSFDNLQTTDIRFLQEAAKYGDLHVLLYTDKFAARSESRTVAYPLAERLYLIENIRYVKKVIIVDSIIDSILSNYAHQAAGQMISWAVREQGVSGQNSSFFTRNGIKFITIPDERLKGFPIEDTPPISPSIKKVMVSGCFDWLHSGHVRFFEEASRFGKLFVVIGHDENLQLLKGEGHPLFPQDQRRYWVQSIRFVHTTLISSGHGWLDAQPEMERYKPDIFIVNHDGDKPEKRELCNSLGIEYRVLARTPKPGLQARVSTNLRGF